MEHEFIAEVVDPGSGEALPDGQVGELVLTNLGRSAMPLIRYRTGDRVVLQRGRCACGRSFARVEGGVLGRVDDMLIIRGNNVFPHTIENLLREFPEVAEFRIAVRQPEALAELRIEVEPLPDAATGDLAERISSVFVDRLHFKPMVDLVNPGCLPRFEMKAGRFVQDGGDS
jgi:phenylacetate-CoA ligase